MSIQYFEREGLDRLAYVQVVPSDEHKDLPTVMFLGGFKSDMSGSKAIFLEEKARERGQGYIRFDYSGHGESGGQFTDGSIGQWKDDALAILDEVVKGDVILVGSSMGGWIALLILLARPERVKGMVGIAAAPDFTLLMEAGLTQEQKDTIAKERFVQIPNDYSDEPYIITGKLLEDGRAQCVLTQEHTVSVPMTLLHGKLDKDVKWETAEAIKKRFKSPQTKIFYVEDGGHRMSREEDLALIDREVQALLHG